MIPLRDNVRVRRFPAACGALIAVNVFAFLADQAGAVVVRYVGPGGVPVQQVMGGLSLHYSLIPANVVGERVGSPLQALGFQPAWVTIFTSMFLHANWLHIGGNMLYLWVFGKAIEDALGPLRFLLFYFAAGVGAAALQIVSDPASAVPTIGASGAIAGVMGAYIYLYPRASILSLVPLFGIIGTFIEIPAVVVIGFWVLLQVINVQWMSGALAGGGGVAYMAHIGGFGTGLVLILALGGRALLRSARHME